MKSITLFILCAASLFADDQQHQITIFPTPTHSAVGFINFQSKDATHAIGLAAPDTVPADFTFRLPATDGGSGSCLTTDGSHNLSFAPCIGSSSNALNVSSSNPMYLYDHFRDDDPNHLYLAYSMDGINFRDITKLGINIGATDFRDPAITKTSDGIYHVIATPASATNVQYITSGVNDVTTWSSITTFNISSYVPGATDSWAPDWLHDGANDYFVIAVSTDGAAHFTPYLFQFNLTTGAIIGSPAALTLNGTSRGQTFDHQIHKYGSTYYMFYADQSNNTPTQHIVWATASSLTGTYTQQTSADYFGFSDQSEAPSVIQLPSGCFRVYADTFILPFPSGRKYTWKYRDSCSGTPFATLVGSTSIRANITASEHGTVIALTSNTDANVIYKAAEQFQQDNFVEGRYGIGTKDPFTTLEVKAAGSHGGILYNEPVGIGLNPGDGNLASIYGCSDSASQFCAPPYGGPGHIIIQYTSTNCCGALQINNTNVGHEAAIQFSNGLTSYGSSPVAVNGGKAVWEIGADHPCFGPAGSCGNTANDWFYVHSGGTSDFPFAISPTTGEVRASYGFSIGGGAGGSALNNNDWVSLYATSSGVLEISAGATPFSGHDALLKIGGLVVDHSGGAVDIHLTGSAGQQRQLLYETGGSLRWNIHADNVSESGSSAGSNLLVDRFNDSGVFQDSPISITRSTGLVTTSLFKATSVNINNQSTIWTSGTGVLEIASGATASGHDSLVKAAGYVADHAGGSVDIHVTGDNAQTKEVLFETGGSKRWLLRSTNTSEAGSNAGSNFSLDRYSDAGSLIDSPLSIVRSTGIVTIPNGVVSSTFNSSATGATNAVQQQSGTFTITGAGNASFQTVAGTTFTGTSFALNSQVTLWTSGTGVLEVASGGAASGHDSLIKVAGVVADHSGGSVDIHITGDNAQTKEIIFETGGSKRWLARSTNTSESGSNAGSNFSLDRYSDAGSLIDSPLSVARATGLVTIPKEAIGVSGASVSHLEEVSGDLWITANAYWDGLHWQRVDISKTAFGMSLQGTNNIPGESVQGANLWVAQPGANPINATFGAVGGWELGTIITANRNLVVGGLGIEIDGSGTTPYARVIHNSSGGVTSGIARNIFPDFSGVDDVTKPSWFAGFVGDQFQVKRAVAGSTSLGALFIVDNSGLVTMPAASFASGAAAIDGSGNAKSLSFNVNNDATLWSTTSNELSVAAGSSASGHNALVRVGEFVIDRSGANATMHISGSSGQARQILYETGGSLRWNLRTSNGAESGSNVGSDLFIDRLDDSGSYLDSPLWISRATGNITVSDLIFLGTAGSFSFRTGTGSPSCASQPDGWSQYDSGANILYICGGGTAHAH